MAIWRWVVWCSGWLRWRSCLDDVIFLAEGGPELLVSAKKNNEELGKFLGKGELPLFCVLT